jgi:flavin prenyltransferase
MESTERKIIVAITGASGSVYALKLLEKIRQLKKQPAEIAILFSTNAKDILLHETGISYSPTGREKVYDNHNFNAPFASGSSSFDTMIICPSSMGTLGRIANGISDDLITRAADVMLKERRKLIMVPRETPYNLIHLTNMKLLTEAGAVILPASPSFYSMPETISDLVLTVVERIMVLAELDTATFRWKE